MDKIVSIIIPTRNNCEYVIMAYESLRKHNSKEHEIIIMDDGSTDNTENYFKSALNFDNNLRYWRDDKNVDIPIGHTITYNIGIELAIHDIVTIFHADMVSGPNYIANLLKHYNDNRIVSGTRIEPPLHPADKAKILKNFGLYAVEFSEINFLNFCNEEQEKSKDLSTYGIFAPWMVNKKVF